jgi:hypothetical protein
MEASAAATRRPIPHLVSGGDLAYSRDMSRAPWLVLVVALFGGCARETGFAEAGEPCVRSTQCVAGLACVAGLCSSDLSGIGDGTLPPRPMDAGPPTDAGTTLDAGQDAGPTPDSGPPPEPDAGPPPEPDAGPPPEPDAGPPPEPDAGPPAEPDAG